jgi:hypothetical protein
MRVSSLTSLVDGVVSLANMTIDLDDKYSVLVLLLRAFWHFTGITR